MNKKIYRVIGILMFSTLTIYSAYSATKQSQTNRSARTAISNQTNNVTSAKSAKLDIKPEPVTEKILLNKPIIKDASSNSKTTELDKALSDTYTECSGISDKLDNIKKMAGINTAITSVGTATGIGATASGFVKAKTDKALEDLLKKLKTLEETNALSTNSNNFNQENFNLTYNNLKKSYESTTKNLQKQSKTLGNVRTGLLATNTATNIAGAVIAGTNKIDEDFETKIENCKEAVSELERVKMQAKINGINTDKADSIIKVCDQYNYIDISSINKRATGAEIASIVGAGTGLSGTITSAVANSDKIRQDEKGINKTEEAYKKEKNLNTAANVLSVGSTVSSGVATVFNATQISAVKKLVKVAEECEGALK